LFLLLCFYVLSISCDCPLPGANFAAATNFEASFATGFKVTVTCGGTANGISNPLGEIVSALYADNNGHPGVRLALSNSFSTSNGVTTANFETPVQVSPGNYWLFTAADAIVPGCLNCYSQQIYGLYGTNLEADFSNVNFDSFGVGQISYSLWLDVETVIITPCEADWQCASLGVNYGFSFCQNGNCACRPNFDGSSTLDSPCTCNNVLVYDQDGNPNCVNSGVCQVGDLIRLDLCSAFTENYMFIECDNGQCECVDGFQGSATASDQCRCDNTLTWTSNGPVCSSD